jgi:hypothetical protein
VFDEAPELNEEGGRAQTRGQRVRSGARKPDLALRGVRRARGQPDVAPPPPEPENDSLPVTRPFMIMFNVSTFNVSAWRPPCVET